MNSPGQYMPNILLEDWRNNSRKNEEMEPKQKQRPVVNVTGNGNKSYAIRKNTAFMTLVESYSISSSGFLPTVVDIMVI